MSKPFKATHKFFDACDDILRHEDCPADTFKFVQSVFNTCKRTGFVSSKQAKCIGGTYKTIVNGGRYVKHDWWN